ncbi:MAG: hypothetical protein IID45_08305, partial [Planctomycetes bacterium]|nr:hypothetical protein [Planctomycetota bacterium]
MNWFSSSIRPLAMIAAVTFSLIASPAMAEVVVVSVPKPKSAVRGGNLFEPNHRVTQALELARKLLKRRDYARGLPRMQQLLNLPKDALFYEDVENQVNFFSVKTEALKAIRSLPPAGQRAYQLRFGIEADQKLKDAIRSGHMNEIREISQQYLYTDAGYKATSILASYEMDRLNPLAAALHFERLRERRDVTQRLKREPMLSLKTAVCWGRAGMPRRSIATLMDLRRLTQGNEIVLGGKSIEMFVRKQDALSWLVTALGRERGFKQIGDEAWTMFRGNASRTALSSKASPVWDSQWSVNQVREAVIDLEDPTRLIAVEQQLLALEKKKRSANVLTLPAAHPLIIGNIVISRSLRDVCAHDLKTGELLWRGIENDKSFRSFAGLDPSGKGASTANLELLLAQRAWRDLTKGTLSSDGKLVYAIERVSFAKANHSSVYRSSRTRLPGYQKFNKLIAYDVKEGKMKWEAGGPVGGEQVNGNLDTPELVAAGAYFLGSPLPFGNRLFCLAELNGEIRLIVLDPQTGDESKPVKLVWSKPLIRPTVGVDRFSLRRMAGLTPSYEGNILVCPTTTGAVVAFDPALRVLLWGYRYHTRTPQQPAQ